MNIWSTHLARTFAATAGVLAALAAAAARGDGGITFNGGGAADAVINNTTADVLGTSHTITITVWAKATGFGEGNYGALVLLKETDTPNNLLVMSHGNDDNLYHVFVDWSGGQAQWNYGAADTIWNCHQMTYDLASTNPPDIYINGTLQSETQTNGASGTAPDLDPGYWVGNAPEIANTWTGDIAHVQIHNRILSKAELDACRQAPGSVVKGLRVWLPVPDHTDTKDRSGNGFHGTAAGTLATASDGPVRTITSHSSDKLSGIRVLPAGITALAQHVIPRFANGAKHPAGELRGWGAKSIIAATQETDNQDNKAIVVTEGNHVVPPEDISEWQNGSMPAMGNYGADPAVLQPTLTDCTIMGYIANYDWTQEGDVNDVPRVHNKMDNDLYDGFDLYGNGGTVRNIGVFGIPGTAGTVTRRGSKRQGFQLEHDRLRWHLDHLYARRCYRGFFLNATDMYAGHIEVEAVRDWGVRIGSSVQFGTIHVYGCGFPEADGGGAAVWITGQQNMGGPLYVENATIGLNDSGQNTTINGITSHTCDDLNVLLAGQACKLNSIDLRSCEVNLRFAGDQNLVNGGRIILQPDGKGIEYIDGTTVDSSSTHNNIRDLVISGYRGDVDGDMVVESHESFAADAIGIDVNTTLKWVNITGVTIGQCTTALDLSGAEIANDGSVIWINTTSDVVNDVIWPAGETWDETFDADESCDIRINGRRFYGPTSGPNSRP